MKHKKLKPFIKWGIYYLLLVLLFAMQTTPRLFEIFSVAPVLIVPLMVAICMYESIVPSTVFCVITGLLWDISSDTLMGFNAIILMTLGVLITLLCIYYLHTKIMNYIAHLSVIMLVQGLLYYLFYFAIWSYEDSHVILLFDILPTALYSIVIGIPIFYLIRFVAYKFDPVVRV